jgi:hypothetical protein
MPTALLHGLRRTLPFWVLASATLAGCAGNTTLPENDRIALQQELGEHARYLKISMRVAPLFQDDAKWLLTDRALDELDLIDDPTGAPVPPGELAGILPPGTRLRIDHIEFPTSFVVTQRVIYSPRFNPWVYLVPADRPSPAEALSNGKPFILVLPQHLKTHDDVLAELDRYLSHNDVTPALRALPQQYQEAIAQKNVLAGMGPSEVEMAWGYPERIHLDEAKKTQVWTWPEKKQEAYFSNNVLAHWTDHGTPGGNVGASE